ncbi:transposase [Streptomyces sp. NPDC092307]|uniref:transposase n=1 Tax=Streptomyces sp. NPDC092307 TaxID=3366013 RepID=UPI00381BBC0A
MRPAGRPDWPRASMDGSHIRAKGGRGGGTGSSPADRRKTGSKHHLIFHGRDTPLAVIITAVNVDDVTQSRAQVDGIPPETGRPGKHTEALPGHKDYDSNPDREELRKRQMLPVISRRGCADIKGTGKLRYAVEQTFASLHQCSNDLPSDGSATPDSTMPSPPSPAASAAGDT